MDDSEEIEFHNPLELPQRNESRMSERANSRVSFARTPSSARRRRYSAAAPPSGEETATSPATEPWSRRTFLIVTIILALILAGAVAFAVLAGGSQDCDRRTAETIEITLARTGACRFISESFCVDPSEFIGSCCKTTGVCPLAQEVDNTSSSSSVQSSRRQFRDVCVRHGFGSSTRDCNVKQNCDAQCLLMHQQCKPSDNVDCIGLTKCEDPTACPPGAVEDSVCIETANTIHFCGSDSGCPAQTQGVVHGTATACVSTIDTIGQCRAPRGGCCLTNGQCVSDSCEHNFRSSADKRCLVERCDGITCVPLRANTTLGKGGFPLGVVHCDAHDPRCDVSFIGAYCLPQSDSWASFRTCKEAFHCPSNTVTRFSERGDVFCDPINATCTTLGECCLTTGLCPRRIVDQCSAADSSLFVACPNATAGNCTGIACRHSRRNCQETRDGVTTCLGLTAARPGFAVNTNLLGHQCFVDVYGMHICERRFCFDYEIISWGADENEAQCLNALAGCPTLGRRGQCCLRTSRCITGSCAANGLGNGTLTNATTPGRRVDCQLITPTCATESGYRYCLGYTVCRANHTCHYSEVDVPCVVTVEGDSRSAILSGTFDLCAQEEFCGNQTAPRFYNGTLQCVQAARHAICHPHEQLGRCCKMNGLCPGELCEANLLGQTVDCTPTTCPKLRCLPLSPSHCPAFHDTYGSPHLGYIDCVDAGDDHCHLNLYGRACILQNCTETAVFSHCTDTNLNAFCEMTTTYPRFLNDSVQCIPRGCPKSERVGECCRTTGACAANTCFAAFEVDELRCGTSGGDACDGLRCVPIFRDPGIVCEPNVTIGARACLGKLKCKDSESTCPLSFPHRERTLCLILPDEKFSVCDANTLECGIETSRSRSKSISRT